MWLRIGLGVAIGWTLPGLAHASAPSRFAAPAGAGESADPKVERARELAQNGGQLYRDGSYDAAIDAFEAAYELVSDPNLLYNISLAHEKAGRLEAAADALDRYRAFAPAEERDKLKLRADELRERAESSEEVDPGPEVSPAARPASPDPEVSEGSETATEPATDAGDAGTKADDRPALMGPVGWTLASLSVAGLGAGAALGISSLGRRDDAKQDCEPGVSEPLCLSTAADDLDASRKLALGADISLAVGGVAAVGTVVWVLVRHKRRGADQTATLTPSFGRGQAGLAVRGRF